jgi:phosphopantothenoylcysteine decarboxylase/phosphopantothenate--cysteine ligase
MNCLITAGATCEPVDRVRVLTNLATGELGLRLAKALQTAGHRVILLLSRTATSTLPAHADVVQRFSTTAELQERLEEFRAEPLGAVFHTAAVSDFRPGRIWHGSDPRAGRLVEAGKIPSDLQPLWLELLPTPKLIRHLQEWFPRAWRVGWKFVVDGSQADALAAGWKQIQLSNTHACVVNGPAYGDGFALLEPGRPVATFPDRETLAQGLARRCSEWERSGLYP